MVQGEAWSRGTLEVSGLRLLDELQRRPGNTPKPLLAVAGEAIDILRDEQLLEPIAMWRYWPVKSVDCDGVMLKEGTRLPLASADEFMTGARSLVVGLCGIGIGAETRISELFRSKHYRLALVMDGYVNRALFCLSEQVLRGLRGEAASAGLCLGQPLAPGNTGFSLDCQGDVIRLAGGVEAGFSVTEAGMVRPGRSLDFVVAMGVGIPKWREGRRCESCQSGSRCFHRTIRDHGRFRDGENGSAAH